MPTWRFGIRTCTWQLEHSALHSRRRLHALRGPAGDRQAGHRAAARRPGRSRTEVLHGRAGLRCLRAARRRRARQRQEETCRGDDAMARYLTHRGLPDRADPAQRLARRDGRPARPPAGAGGGRRRRDRGVPRDGADHLLSALADRRSRRDRLPSSRRRCPGRTRSVSTTPPPRLEDRLRARLLGTAARGRHAARLQHHGPGRAGRRNSSGATARCMCRDRASRKPAPPRISNGDISSRAISASRSSTIAASASAWRSATTAAGRKPIACCASTAPRWC